MQDCWQPFHDTLQALIGGTRAVFGGCLLIDCHSMPSHGTGRPGGRAPDFVLGDAHGTACYPAVTQFVERRLADLGYAVRRNDPYAGGYITRHYGRPREARARDATGDRPRALYGRGADRAAAAVRRGPAGHGGADRSSIAREASLLLRDVS